jgi:hypothetical protein
MSTELIKYEAARRAVAEARSVDEVKAIKNLAERAQLHARQVKDTEMMDAATDIQMRAKRRLGEVIIEQKKTVGLNQGGGGRDTTGARKAPVDQTPDPCQSRHQQEAVGQCAETGEVADQRVRAEGGPY